MDIDQISILSKVKLKKLKFPGSSDIQRFFQINMAEYQDVSDLPEDDRRASFLQFRRYQAHLPCCEHSHKRAGQIQWSLPSLLNRSQHIQDQTLSLRSLLPAPWKLHRKAINFLQYVRLQFPMWYDLYDVQKAICLWTWQLLPSKLAYYQANTRDHKI